VSTRTDPKFPSLGACPEWSGSACPELAEGIRGARGVMNKLTGYEPGSNMALMAITPFYPPLF